MTYYTYSQGFRPGGFNRTSSADGVPILKGVAAVYAHGNNQFNKPAGYDSDNLTNLEVGLKTEFFEHRVQLNASAYVMHWNNVQLPLFDPVQLGNTTFDVNGPSYTVKGGELQLVARVFDGLTIQGSGSWNAFGADQRALPQLIRRHAIHSEQPDRGRYLHHASQRQAVHQPVRRARHLARVLAARSVQHARALRLGQSTSTSRS